MTRSDASGQSGGTGGRESSDEEREEEGAAAHLSSLTDEAGNESSRPRHTSEIVLC